MRYALLVCAKCRVGFRRVWGQKIGKVKSGGPLEKFAQIVRRVPLVVERIECGHQCDGSQVGYSTSAVREPEGACAVDLMASQQPQQATERKRIDPFAHVVGHSRAPAVHFLYLAENLVLEIDRSPQVPPPRSDLLDGVGREIVSGGNLRNCRSERAASTTSGEPEDFLRKPRTPEYIGGGPVEPLRPSSPSLRIDEELRRQAAEAIHSANPASASRA